ncbi:lymphatic vessel endothelial hyaluronic receptor 1b [Xiphias gladius]|uniref:lymphatic vessel endothelial hyaluronic receptor 1b n=1 Tax=Xiphias gladius TaxID=8245 RepID=UPI001A97E5BB|nr:lymphatic vessel endothelial hyaluronic receptor 1b [Xiphias gladius]
MARFWFFTQFLALCFSALFPASESNAIRAPQSHQAAGVFMLIEGGKYTLNFTAARAACLFLNVTIATRDQMERAVQRGLETCKFGWIAEQIAAVPRRTSDKKCGKGKTGLVLWSASEDKKFGVFCFRASDLEEAPKTTEAAPQTSTCPTTLTAPTQSSAPTTARLKSTTGAAPSTKPPTTQSPGPTSLPFTLLFQTTRSTRPSSTSPSLGPFSTRIPTSLSHPITSGPTVATFAFSTSASAPPQTVSSAKPYLGAVPTALIVLGVLLPLLAAAGAAWHHRLNIFTLRSPGRAKDDAETEMWKRDASETDLRGRRGAEEDDECEEADGRCSGDVPLCASPGTKRPSSE